MSFYADQMHQVLTRRAGDWLARNAWPHLTMLGAFCLSAWTAYECSQYIVGWGGFALRFSINFLAAYVSFVLCLGAWLGTKSALDRTALLDGAPKFIETKNPWDDEAVDAQDQLIEATKRSLEREAGQNGLAGLIGLAFVALVIGTIFVAGHMIWYARWYLGRLLVLGGKVQHRALPDTPALPWLAAPLRITALAAAILWVHYALLGLLLQWACPKAVTIADIPGCL